jgi:hypothetical protein
MKTTTDRNNQTNNKVAYLPLPAERSPVDFEAQGALSADPQLQAQGIIEVPLPSRTWAQVQEMAVSALVLFKSRGRG